MENNMKYEKLRMTLTIIEIIILIALLFNFHTRLTKLETKTFCQCSPCECQVCKCSEKEPYPGYEPIK